MTSFIAQIKFCLTSRNVVAIEQSSDSGEEPGYEAIGNVYMGGLYTL